MEKGLRWRLPKNSDMIELHTDYKFFAKRALNDEENLQNPCKRPRNFQTAPAINEYEDKDEGSYENSQNQPAVAEAMCLEGLANLLNFLTQFTWNKTRHPGHPY